MADITVTPANVRPLEGAVIRRHTAGAAFTFGEAVYIHSGGTVKEADANASLLTALAIGIVIAPSPGNPGASSVATGDVCDVVTEGPVTGFSGMTPGTQVWLSNTAGAVADAVSATHSCVMGFAESATVLFVRPFTAVRST